MHYRKALIQALKSYPAKVHELQFISQESKPVFRVHTDAGCFAAKFHNPSELPLSQMTSEMQYLYQVSDYSSMCIEKPFANENGEFITEIKSHWLPETAHVALCSWIPGRKLKDFTSKRSYCYLGRSSAELHKASDSFVPDKEFKILTINKVFYWDKETILSKNDPKLLPQQRQDLFKEGASLARKAIKKIWKSRPPIVIHNDLHPCNLKVNRGNLSMYDFEDIAWGFPEQDIGTAMYHIRFRKDYPELLNAFRKGYQEVQDWPLDSDRQLDYFIMARLLMFANYVVNYSIKPSYHLPRYETKLRKLLTGKNPRLNPGK